MESPYVRCLYQRTKGKRLLAIYVYIYRERALEEERLHYKVIEKKKPFENQRKKKNKLNITQDKTNM